MENNNDNNEERDDAAAHSPAITHQNQDFFNQQNQQEQQQHPQDQQIQENQHEHPNQQENSNDSTPNTLNTENRIHQVLDEQSIQRLVESGTVSEDSIIAIVQDDNGEPQTVVLTRQEAEELGIRLDPVEPSPSPSSSVQSEVQQSSPIAQPKTNVEEFKAADVKDKSPEPSPEPSPESSSEPLPEPLPEPKGPSSEPLELPDVSKLFDGHERKSSPTPETTETAVTAESVEMPPSGEEQQTTVSLDSVPGEGSANDVLSNIIQSLFNPNDPNQSNVSIVPRMVGGKRKLCLRLPASTASALLAQTGSPLATTFQEGGIPKKIKIVIPPSAVTSTTSSMTEQKVIKVSMHGSHALKTATEAKSPTKSSKPFLASLFSGSSRYQTFLNTFTPYLLIFNFFLFISSASSTVAPAARTLIADKNPLGSTENPIQLVQEGNNFRSLQPLTPEQLQHIASVLKQNRQVPPSLYTARPFSLLLNASSTRLVRAIFF